MATSSTHATQATPDAVGPRAHALVVEPVPGERRRLAIALGPGTVLDVETVQAAESVVPGLSATLLVLGPGVTSADVHIALGRSDRHTAVILVRDTPWPADERIAQVVRTADADAALETWTHALRVLRPSGAADRRVDEMVRHSPEAMIAVDAVTDEQGVPVDVVVSGANLEGELVLGIDLATATGMPLLDTPGLAGATRLRERCVQALRGGLARELDLTLGDRWLGCRVVPSDGGATLTLRDVTRRRRTEARRKALAGLTDAMAHGADIEALLAQTVELAARSLDTDFALLGRCEPDGPPRVVAISRGAAPEADAVTNTSALTLAARTGTSVRATGRSAHRAPLWEAATPIILDGRPWGALSVATTEVDRLADDTEEVLRRFANLLSIALRNERSRTELMTRATTDSLTGVANRQAFGDRLARELDRAVRYGRPLAIAIVDLDMFKTVNDRFGHQAGDRVLREAAARLQLEARTADLLARIGGEEFAWLMPETDVLAAWRAVDRARRRISDQPFPGVGTVTTSAGVCDTSVAENADQLFAAADEALYRAKRTGRNRVVSA